MMMTTIVEVGYINTYKKKSWKIQEYGEKLVGYSNNKYFSPIIISSFYNYGVFLFQLTSTVTSASSTCEGENQS